LWPSNPADVTTLIPVVNRLRHLLAVTTDIVVLRRPRQIAVIYLSRGSLNM
jgi:hypothetical protein